MRGAAAKSKFNLSELFTRTQLQETDRTTGGIRKAQTATVPITPSVAPNDPPPPIGLFFCKFLIRPPTPGGHSNQPTANAHRTTGRGRPADNHENNTTAPTN